MNQYRYRRELGQEEVEHVPSFEKLVGLYDGGPWYVGTCSCGKYRSRRVAYPGHAQGAAREHAEAKNHG